MLQLRVIDGPDEGNRLPLPPGEPQLLGRSSEALPLTDRAISRRHAELTPDQGRWYVRDLDSASGTMLNGARLTSRSALAVGDELRCGRTRLLVEDVNTPLGGPARTTHQQDHQGGRTRGRTARATNPSGRGKPRGVHREARRARPL